MSPSENGAPIPPRICDVGLSLLARLPVRPLARYPVGRLSITTRQDSFDKPDPFPYDTRSKLRPGAEI